LDNATVAAIAATVFTVIGLFGLFNAIAAFRQEKPSASERWLGLATLDGEERRNEQ
jgi:hypothetical protein